MTNLAQKYASFISEQIKEKQLAEGFLRTKMPHTMFDEHVDDLAEKHGLTKQAGGIGDWNKTSSRSIKLSGGSLGDKHHLRLEYTPDKPFNEALSMGGSMKAHLNVHLIKRGKKNKIIDTQSITIKNHKHMKAALADVDNYLTDFSAEINKHKMPESDTTANPPKPTRAF